MLWKWTFIYLIHSFWSLLCCVFFFVPRSKVQPLQHHTLPHRHTHNNHGYIPVILEAVQAHEHSVPLGCWGSPKSHVSSSSHLGMHCAGVSWVPNLLYPRKWNQSSAVPMQAQTALSAVLLCHTSSTGWQIPSASHKLMWQVMEELTTKARLSWLV